MISHSSSQQDTSDVEHKHGKRIRIDFSFFSQIGRSIAMFFVERAFEITAFFGFELDMPHVRWQCKLLLDNHLHIQPSMGISINVPIVGNDEMLLICWIYIYKSLLWIRYHRIPQSFVEFPTWDIQKSII